MFVLYDPATGAFYWRSSAGHGSCERIAGDRAGWIDSKGHRKIQLPSYTRGFLEHRLAWLYMTGAWPSDQIDHENRIKDDNRWDNLRPANNSRNQANRGLRPHNKSGVTGVCAQGDGWLAECSVDGRRWRKWFKTKGEAVAARQLAVQRLHGEFAVKR
jgi:hypothetical protein